MTECVKPVTRKTLVSYRGRTLVATLHPTFVSLRQSGKRTAFVLEYGAAFECAMKLAAREARADKLAAKKARRTAK